MYDGFKVLNIQRGIRRSIIKAIGKNRDWVNNDKVKPNKILLNNYVFRT